MEHRNIKTTEEVRNGMTVRRTTIVFMIGGLLVAAILANLIHNTTEAVRLILETTLEIRDSIKEANERIEQYIAQNSLSTMDDLQKLDNIDED